MDEMFIFYPSGLGTTSTGARNTSMSSSGSSSQQRQELSADVFSAPNVQFFAVNDSAMISMVQLPHFGGAGASPADGLVTPPSQVRFIARHLGGKTAWDGSILFRASRNNSSSSSNNVQQTQVVSPGSGAQGRRFSSSHGGGGSGSSMGEEGGDRRAFSAHGRKLSHQQSSYLKEGSGKEVDSIDEVRFCSVMIAKTLGKMTLVILRMEKTFFLLNLKQGLTL